MVLEAPQSEPPRVQTACQFCRYSKLKCSGTVPCDRCQKRSKECIYDTRGGPDTRRHRPAPRKRRHLDRDPNSLSGPSLVSLSPLPLPETIASQPISVPQARSQDGEDASPQFLRNRPDKPKRWLYLGASSTWSFNIRVATLMHSYLEDDPNDKYEGFTLDGDVHPISLRKSSSDNALDFTRLPSLDYAIYLINTVKFHLGGILQLFDEQDFLESLHEFYSKDPEAAKQTNRIWYTQFLLLLALGKGFLNVRHSPNNTSSSDLFLRAMSILPDTIALHNEPVLAAEVLATIALYFYCLDMRNCAYSYIGQAMRLALVEGTHADLPVEQIGAKFSARCRNLWWTVYILDRTLSSAVGAPVSVQDCHIRQPLGCPKQSSQRDATLIMHVKLCRVVSFILNELYTANGNLGQSYLSKTRSVLLHMAEIAKELEDTIDYKFKSSLETLSKGALYLRMLYNQCIILATRPLLICLLQDLLGSLSTESGHRAEIPSSIHDLLQTCTVYATKTLKMLASLHDHNLLDTFLPFDLEFACSASSALIMVDEVLQGYKVPAASKSLIPKLLDEIAQGGNKAAPSRHAEIQQVSHLASRLWESIDLRERRLSASQYWSSLNPAQERERVIVSDNTGSTSADAQNGGTDVEMRREDPSLFMPAFSTTSSADFVQTFDFSQEQMLFLADHLADDDLPSMLNFGDHGLDEWM